MKINCEIKDYSGKDVPVGDEKIVTVSRHWCFGSDRIVIEVGDEKVELLASELTKAIDACTGYVS